MTIKCTFVAAAAAVALAGCSTATQPTQVQTTLARASCEGISDLDQEVAHLYASRVSRVEKLWLDRPTGTAPHTRAGEAQRGRYLAGATFHVPAERGVSSAYLDRVLSCHAMGPAGPNDQHDPLRVAGVHHVRVHEAGPELRVAIAGASSAAGEAIFQRAQALSSRSGQVEIRQLSAARSVAGTL